MGWLIFLAIVILLAILPLGASVLYDEDGPRVRVLAGPVKIQVFPMKKKPKKDKTKKEKPKKERKKSAQAGEEQKPFPKPKTGGSWTDFLPLVQTALDLLNAFRKKLRYTEIFICSFFTKQISLVIYNSKEFFDTLCKYFFFSCHFNGDRTLGQIGIGTETANDTFDLADVALEMLTEEVQYVDRNIHTHIKSFLSQDRDAEL